MYLKMQMDSDPNVSSCCRCARNSTSAYYSFSQQHIMHNRASFKNISAGMLLAKFVSPNRTRPRLKSPWGEIDQIIFIVTFSMLLLSCLPAANACYVYPPDVKDPCEGRVCSFGARCVPSLDLTAARCECPARCDSYGDSVGSNPVCGNDGVDYPNMCEMRRAACRQMKDIRVKYYGKCGKWLCFYLLRLFWIQWCYLDLHLSLKEHGCTIGPESFTAGTHKGLNPSSYNEDQLVLFHI